MLGELSDQGFLYFRLEGHQKKREIHCDRDLAAFAALSDLKVGLKLAAFDLAAFVILIKEAFHFWIKASNPFLFAHEIFDFFKSSGSRDLAIMFDRKFRHFDSLREVLLFYAQSE